MAMLRGQLIFKIENAQGDLYSDKDAFQGNKYMENTPYGAKSMFFYFLVWLIPNDVHCTEATTIFVMS